MTSQKYTGLFYSDFEPQKSSVRKDKKKPLKISDIKKNRNAISKKNRSGPIGSDLQIGVVNYDK